MCANELRRKVARADFLTAALGVLTMQIGRQIYKSSVIAACANAPNAREVI